MSAVWKPLKEEVFRFTFGWMCRVDYADGSSRTIPLMQYLYENEVGRELMPHEFVRQRDDNPENFMLDNIQLMVLHPDWPENTSAPVPSLKFITPYRVANIYCKRSGRYYIDLYYCKGGKRKRKAKARFIFEKYLNRELTMFEDVDHIDEDKTNDVIENLQVLSNLNNLLKHHHYLGHNIGEDVYSDFICAHCQKPFKRIESMVKDPDDIFCGRACAGKHSQDKLYPNGPPTLDLNCDHCGISFKKVKAIYERQKKGGTNYFYCSLKCSAPATLKRFFPNPVKIGNYICSHCNKSFQRKKAQVDAAVKRGNADIFCSKSCSVSVRNMKQRGIKK